MIVLTFGAVNKDVTRKTFSDNHGHNILKFFDVLQHFLLTISGTNRDY